MRAGEEERINGQDGQRQEEEERDLTKKNNHITAKNQQYHRQLQLKP